MVAHHPRGLTRLATVGAVVALSACGAATLLVHGASPTATVAGPAAVVDPDGGLGAANGGPGAGHGGWRHGHGRFGAGSGGPASNGGSGGGSGGGPGGSVASGAPVRPATRATAAQTVGVVNVLTVLDHGREEGAGTGIVLTSSGRVLTNDHVVAGATSVSVVDLTTGRRYRAAVVGDSPTDDVAVLQLENAGVLRTAPLGDSNTVAVGQTVTGVGNAGNAPGTSAAVGTVTALGQAITARDVGSPRAERITGLIETSADVQPGDSGGPLLDASGEVVGMDTAAATNRRTGATEAGYAIPIDHAIEVANRLAGGG